MEIGKYTYGYPKTHWGEIHGTKVIIGKFCSIAEGCNVFLGGYHNLNWVSTYPFGHIHENVFTSYSGEGHPHTKGNVVIGNDVYIASNVTILSGVTIGDGAVIACNSVVTKNVEPYTMVGGNPARFIRKRFTEEQINKMLQIKWWDWDENKIDKHSHLLSNPDINTFIKATTVYNNECQQNAIIFIHIPKTAGHTVGRCLRDIGVLKNGYGFSHKIARNIVKTEDRKCILLGIVRNPFDRLYSLYEFYKKKRDDIPTDITFENFIMNFEEKFYLKKEQFDTCYNFLTDENGKLMTTDIIKFENLHSEYDKFCNKYGIQNNLNHTNKNELKDTDIDWSKLYTDQMRRRVYNVFYNDFETFNYTYSDFLKSKGIDIVEHL